MELYRVTAFTSESDNLPQQKSWLYLNAASVKDAISSARDTLAARGRKRIEICLIERDDGIGGYVQFFHDADLVLVYDEPAA